MDLKKNKEMFGYIFLMGGNPSLKVNIFTQKDNILGNV